MTPETPTRVVPKLEHEGYAAEDLKEDSIVLEVICPELMPQAATGTLAAGISNGSITLKDRDGNPITSQQTTANHIVATWEGASNSRYPPMVRKGEPVILFKRANQDKYYWKPKGNGRDFRKTDRVYFEVGASNPDKPSTEKSDSNTYSGYLDSVNQKVGIKTSKDNGEAFALSMEADLKAGTFHISDDSESPGNRIFLDVGTVSGVPTFQVNLTSGIVFKFENENGFIKIPKNFEIDAGERIVLNSPITVFNLSSVGNIIMNAASVAINGTKEVVITAGVAGINAASTKIGGVLVAATARIANAIKGAFGSTYNPTTIARPEDSPVYNPSNSADTSSAGQPYKTE